MIVRLGIVSALLVVAALALIFESGSELSTPPGTPTPDNVAAPLSPANSLSQANVIARPTPTPNPAVDHLGIYFVNRDGSGLRRIVEGEVFWADLSPDGTEVIYRRDNQFVITDVQTGVTRVVVTPPAEGYLLRPKWSSAGTYISFSMDEKRGVKSTWLVRPDGSGVKQLFADKGHSLFVGDWLRDDSVALAVTDQFVEYGVSASPPSWDIVRITPDGSISDPLAEYEPCYCGAGINFPRVSPDGEQFAYSDHTGDVFVLNLDGTESHNITPGTDFAYLVDWTLDGEGVVYVTFEFGAGGGTPTLYRFDLLDETTSPILSFSRSIAPDGTVVRGLLLGCSQPEGLIINSPDGTSEDLVGDRIPGMWYLNSAQWLPDGSGIVFVVSLSNRCA